jgi:hypothetical protein
MVFGFSGYIPTMQAQFGAIAYDPQNPNTIYAGDGWEYAEDLYLYKSLNGGESWENLKFMDGDRFYWEQHGVADIWVHPNDSNILLVAVEGWGAPNNAGGVYRSVNGGVTWNRSLSWWSTTLAADPVHPNIIFAGTRQCGTVYRSDNAGIGWMNITPNMPPGECWVWSVNDIEVDSDGTVYAATSSGLKKWDGQAWSQLTGFPGVGVKALVMDRGTVPATIYLGTGSYGVYFSKDSGGTWTALNEGLGNLSIVKLALTRYPHKILYAGTLYSGVWVREINQYKLHLPLIFR